jgi:hypothetical protein
MALEGTLHDMALTDLIQVFPMGSKTGVLRLMAPTEWGLIYVAAGRMVDAVVIRVPERTVVAVHDEAVLHMLAWSDASFVFHHDPAVVSRPRRIAHEGEWLVLESLRRRDDPTRAVAYQQVHADTRLQLTPLPTGGCGVSLDVQQWRILSQIDHHTSLYMIAQQGGIGLNQVLRIAAELLALGLVEIVPEARSVARPRKAEQNTEHGRLQPALMVAGVPGMVMTQPRPAVGRNLLDAVLRRVRGL